MSLGTCELLKKYIWGCVTAYDIKLQCTKPVYHSPLNVSISSPLENKSYTSIRTEALSVIEVLLTKLEGKHWGPVQCLIKAEKCYKACCGLIFRVMVTSLQGSCL